jgi:molybdopterin-guanine dinucleotide biosynthesis adapter protein
MKIFGLVGWSGSGKTTLLVSLLPELVGRGITVSTVKHTHHNVDVDKPGKDSYRHRNAGATEVVLLSSSGWTVMHPLRGAPEPTTEELMTRLTPVDLLLVEGFKKHPHDKLEVHRPALAKPLLCRDDPTVVAVASDTPVEEHGLTTLDLNDVVAIADFVIDHCRLQGR